MSEQVDSFVFYRSILQAARSLQDDAATLRFLNMIFDYGFDGKMAEPERSAEYACFLASYKAIESALKRRKASVENGRKGGRPREQHDVADPEEPERYSVSDLACKAGYRQGYQGTDYE